MNTETPAELQNSSLSQFWNHYVVIEGRPPQKFRLALLQWLRQHSAIPLSDSDQVYFYLSKIGVSGKEKLLDEIRELRQAYEKDKTPEKYRIYFLGPDWRYEMIY